MSRQTPLLGVADSSGRSDGSLTLDEWYAVASRSRFPPAAAMFCISGIVGYVFPAMIVLSPAYIDRLVVNETTWFDDSTVGLDELSSSTTALFAFWGPGALIFTAVADRKGRRSLLLAVLLCSMSLTALSALAPSFAVYAVARALSGAFIGAGGAIGYVLCAEWSSPAQLSFITNLLNICYALAATIMTGVVAEGHALGLSWRVQILILVGLHAGYACLALPFLLESPRFLLSSNQHGRAEASLRVAMRRCGKPMGPGTALLHLPAAARGPCDEEGMASSTTTPASCEGAATIVPDAAAATRTNVNNTTTANNNNNNNNNNAGGSGGGACAQYCLLFRPPTLQRMLIIGYGWFAVSVLYYGLGFSIGKCEPPKCDPYVSGFLMNLVDVPGALLCFWLADTIGRRRTFSSFFLLGGLCLLVTPLATRYIAPQYKVPLVLSLVGKACASACFACAYMFPAELFPTKIRASALGVCNIFARLGTMISPFAEDLPIVVTQLVLGTVALTAGLLALFLPETRGQPLED